MACGFRNGRLHGSQRQEPASALERRRSRRYKWGPAEASSRPSSWIRVLEDIVRVVFLFLAAIVIISRAPNSAGGFVDGKVLPRTSDEKFLDKMLDRENFRHS